MTIRYLIDENLEPLYKAQLLMNTRITLSIYLLPDVS